MKRACFLLSVLVWCGWWHSAAANAQGTAFTYQGRLNVGGSPATGAYDLQFTLYDSTNDPGVMIAGPLTNSAVAVSNGLFTVWLDFGAGAFDGAARWLEVSVRTNGAASPFATLAPRQLLSPAPYAIFAAGANAAGLTGTIPATNIASGTITSNLLAPGSVGPGQLAGNVGFWNQAGASLYYNGGNVGVGTTSPAAPLHIVGNNPFPQLDVAAGPNAPYGSFLGLDATAITGGQDYLLFSTGGDAGEGVGKLVVKNQTAGIYPLVMDGTGKVGVGTVNPQAQLHVLGSSIPAVLVESSASGTYFALQNDASGGRCWQIDSTSSQNSSGGGNLRFIVGETVTSPANDVMILTSLGRVGIDNIYPTAPLEVGSATCDGANWNNASDRNLKENFSPVDPESVLEKVAALPITEWNYKRDRTVTHLGPVAQDFHAAFMVGGDDKHIATVDEGGVALAAIQGLNRKLTDELARRDRDNTELKQQLAEIKATLQQLMGKDANGE